MKDYNITRVSKIEGRGGGLAFGLQGWLDLSYNGHSSREYYPFTDDTMAFVAHSVDVPQHICGALFYRVNEQQQKIEIQFGMIRSDHQRKGLYEELFRQLVDYHRFTKIYCIETHIHPDNTAMISAAKKRGMKQSASVFRWIKK